MSIVIDLRKNIISNNRNITDLLREALVIASKLKLDDFKKWINCELKGYQGQGLTLPEYRMLSGTLKFYNPYHGWTLAQYNMKELEQLINNSPILQPISELESLISNSENKTFTYPLPSDIIPTLQKMFSVKHEPGIQLTLEQLVGIVEQVKTTLLEWVIKLEDNKILGDKNMSFSNEEQEKAHKNINIEHFHGVMGNINNTGNLSNGDFNHNTTTINNNIKLKLNNLIKKINDLDIDDKKEVIQKINDTKEDKEKLIQVLGQLMTRGSEIATIAPAIGELLGLLG